MLRRAEQTAIKFDSVLLPHGSPEKALAKFGEYVLGSFYSPEMIDFRRHVLSEQ